jgi:hypothetical protein
MSTDVKVTEDPGAVSKEKGCGRTCGGGNESCGASVMPGPACRTERRDRDACPFLLLCCPCGLQGADAAECFLLPLLAASDESCPLRPARCALPSADERGAVRCDAVPMSVPHVWLYGSRAARWYEIPWGVTDEHSTLLSSSRPLGSSASRLFFCGNQRNISHSNELSTCPS